MTPEWLSAIVAVIAAFVAGGAAIVAYSQAISARRQANSSEIAAGAAIEQVKAAQDAAASAREQAEAAKASNLISEQALALEVAKGIRATKRLLSEVADSADDAFSNSLFNGDRPKAEANAQRLEVLGKELQHLDLPDTEEAQHQMSGLIYKSAELPFVLKANNYDLAFKDVARAQCIELNSGIAAHVDAIVKMLTGKQG